MLSTVVTSKARLKVINYFYQGGKDFSPYVREIVRGTGLEINAVRRELIKLTKSKLFIEEPRGNRVHYHLNPKHAIYYDLASLVARDVGIGGDLYRKKKKLGNVRFILMSLNFFLKDPTKNPIDIIIVGSIYLSDVKKLIDKHQKDYDREINYMVLTDSEYRVLKDRKDPLIVNILSQPRCIIYGSQEKFLSL
jgi:hypothetical protein